MERAPIGALSMSPCQNHWPGFAPPRWPGIRPALTLGNRQATEFRPLRGVTEAELADAALADAAQLASLADETPEGRSIVVLAKEKYNIRARDMAGINATFVPFTAQSRMSGVDVEGSSIRKGAVDSILGHVQAVPASAARGGAALALKPAVAGDAVRETQAISDDIGKAGGTPLVEEI